jgi:hypothetical protein
MLKGRDWTDYSVLPLESFWLCSVYEPDESISRSCIALTTKDMHSVVQKFLNEDSEGAIFCEPVSQERSIELLLQAEGLGPND